MSEKEAADKNASSLVTRAYEHLIFYPRNASERSYNEDFEGRGPGFIRYTNLTDLLASFFLGTRAPGGKAFNWRDMCVGISSAAVPPGSSRPSHHVPFLDYDGKHIKTAVKQDVKLLQKKFGLGPASVYHTKRGAHVYFLHDLVPQELFRPILEATNCCSGFKKASINRGFAILRVSAKYTEFDIALEQVIPAIDTRLRRKTRKGHIIEALLGLGTGCGTHLASLFPGWAHYVEDPRPWKTQTKRPPHERGKFIIKLAEPAPPPPPPALVVPKDNVFTMSDSPLYAASYPTTYAATSIISNYTVTSIVSNACLTGDAKIDYNYRAGTKPTSE